MNEQIEMFADDDDENDRAAPIFPARTQSNFDAALEWWRRGFNVVPQKAVAVKHPGVKWKEFQTRRVTQAELLDWREKFELGVGFISGAISGVVVIDTDGPEGEAVVASFEAEFGKLPETLVVRSGSGRGFHRYFKHPGQRVKTNGNADIKIDVKGDDGYVVLPPSRHKSGGEYEVVHDAEIADLPEGLVEFIEQRAREARGAKSGCDRASRSKPKPRVGTLIDPVPEHVREAGLERNVVDLHEPPGFDETREMLTFLNDQNAFADRAEWIKCGMALKAAYSDEVGFELWSITHEDDRARADAPTQWASFSSEVRPGDVTIGSLVKLATDAGFKRERDMVVDSEQHYLSFGPFTMDAHEGLTKDVDISRGKVTLTETLWLSEAFEILGRCRNPHGVEWGRLIRFSDADRRIHLHHVADEALHGEPGALCAALASKGLRINISQHKPFAEYCNRARVKQRATIVERTGWHAIGGKLVFVLPAETIAASDLGESVVLDAVAHGPYESKGTLDEWKNGVGELAKGQTLPVFAVSAALSGPLAHLLGAEGGGVHLFGPSSIGKSSLLAAAASVWGRGDTTGFVRSWRATANGLEGVAASATDTTVLLDEIGLAEPRDVAAAIYTLANGVGKVRSHRDTSLRAAKSWRVSVLSSGEFPIETKLAEDRGRKTRAGQTIRLLDVPADRGLGYGAFNHAGALEQGGKLADALKSAATASFGTAGPEFVRRLVASNIDRIVAGAKKGVEAFAQKATACASKNSGKASEQVGRAAQKFALIAVAGEFATALGVTPWTKGEARDAAVWAFERWIEKRGGAGSHEERQAVEQVRLMIEQHGESRFEEVSTIKGNIGTGGTIRDRLGWRKGEGDGVEWMVPPEIWKNEVCAGLDAGFVARTLYQRGMLRRQDEKNLACKVAIGEQRLRAYVLTSRILSGDDEG